LKAWDDYQQTDPSSEDHAIMDCFHLKTRELQNDGPGKDHFFTTEQAKPWPVVFLM
jgi:hypothetical protein